MQTTSPSLLRRLRLPDQPEARARFVRLYSPMRYTWARRLGVQYADAERILLFRARGAVSLIELRRAPLVAGCPHIPFKLTPGSVSHSARD